MDEGAVHPLCGFGWLYRGLTDNRNTGVGVWFGMEMDEMLTEKDRTCDKIG